MLEGQIQRMISMVQCQFSCHCVVWSLLMVFASFLVAVEALWPLPGCNELDELVEGHSHPRPSSMFA